MYISQYRVIILRMNKKKYLKLALYSVYTWHLFSLFACLLLIFQYTVSLICREDDGACEMRQRKTLVLKFWKKVPISSSSFKLYLRRASLSLSFSRQRSRSRSRTYVTIITGGRIRRIAGSVMKQVGAISFNLSRVEEHTLVEDLVDLVEISDDNLRTATTRKERIVAVLKLSCINQGALPGTATSVWRKRCF